MEEPEQKPLLDMEQGAEAEWERVDELPPGIPTITVQELIQQDPDNVLANIKAGVVKLGEFRVEDTLLLAALGDRPMLTLGAADANIDFESAWRARLAALAGRRGGGGGRGSAGWSRLVTAECFVVRIRNAAAPDNEGLIRPLVRRWQAGGCHYSVFGLPAVQAVLEFKWETFGRRALVSELLCFVAWLLSFSAFLLIWQDEDPALTLDQLLATRRGQATVAAELLAVAAMAPFLFIEAATVAAYSVTGWLSLWNSLDIATYVIQIAVTAMHLGRIGLTSYLFTNLVAAQAVLLFFRLNYFSRLFANKFSFVDSLRQVVLDCRFYLLFLLVMLWGFACSYYTMFKWDQDLPQFNDISHSLLTVLGYAMGGVDLGTMLDSGNPHAAIALSLVYQFSMSMVLMNLLVGVMCSSVSQATRHEELQGLLSRAQVVDELDSTVPSWLDRMWRPDAYPAFVHVLRLDPKSLELTDASMMWRRTTSKSAGPPGVGGGEIGGEIGGGGGGGGGGAQLQEVLGQLAALRAQVATLNELLHTAVPSLPPSPERLASP